ncbi:MAG: aminodeoxychorismate synthase component I [Actinomyces sp.]|nr:MAG: aminodeoxychorismate synthase component I [Actinomyces sp.]
MERALVRWPSGTGRRWLSFERPVGGATALALDEVPAVLAEVERAAARGLWSVGFVSYDASPAFDPALRARRDPDVPLAAFGFFGGARRVSGPADLDAEAGAWHTAWSQADHAAALARVHELIAAGETYQVNVTHRLRARFAGEPEGLFAALCRAQRAEHQAFVELGSAAVCSASPELFLRRRGEQLESRPMKGTRPRHPDPAVDQSLADALVASPKDRAENTMIVDMMRNDLGRIARVGTVRVPALHRVEHYPTVHQMVSVVTAETDAGLAEIFAACFPAASITGAPKVRTSAIIAELEADARGVYCGAVGTVAPAPEPGHPADFEFNVAIRTAWVDRRRATVTYGVGGGIVWDSDTDEEWAECGHKARILTRALPAFRLLETLLWDPDGGCALLDEHLDRLAGSAAHFGYEFHPDEARRRLTRLDGDEAGVVRVLVAPDGAVEIQRRPLPSRDGGPVRLAFDTVPVDPGDEFLRHKTTRRARYDEARARRPGADDVVLWTPDGEVTETSIANLVVDVDGRLVTPRLEAGLLAGTLRRVLLEEGRVVEARVGIDDLLGAERVWTINSVRGWSPATVDARTAPRLPGRRTEV